MEPFSWLKEPEGERNVYHLSGRVDETTDFRPIVKDASGDVTFDLSGIERMNSSGVMRWGRFIRDVSKRTASVRFVRCSPVIVNQLNMIKDFAGGAVIESFYAPYICEECGTESTTLVEVDEHREALIAKQVPPQSCPACNQEMVLNSLEDSYLSFLRDEQDEQDQG